MQECSFVPLAEVHSVEEVEKGQGKVLGVRRTRQCERRVEGSKNTVERREHIEDKKRR